MNHDRLVVYGCSLEHVHGGMHPREFLHRQLADHLSNKIQEKIK